MVSGLPGAGKTTLLERASVGAAITVISRDLIRAAMFPGPGRHSAQETRLAFEAMLAAAGSRLGGGGRVALDGCCFARQWQRQRVRELARGTGAVLVAVRLELPVDEAVRRIGRRGDHPANDRDAVLVAGVAAHLPPPEPGEAVIDATRRPDEVWAQLSRRLEAAATARGA